MTESAKVQVVMRHRSYGIKQGQRVSVDKATADALVANGHADLAAKAPDKK